MPSHFSKTPDATSRARVLRRDMTEVEKQLWHMLRAQQLGISFRRQHPIGPYIADFCAPSLKLIIELDGGQHALSAARDDARTAWLTARGYRVLRFWNNDVTGNRDGVLQEIARVVADLKPSPCKVRVVRDLSSRAGSSPRRG
jgi:very-short-patch-repair endonuclease